MKVKLLFFLLFVITISALGLIIGLLANTSPETKAVIWLFYGSFSFFIFGISFFLLYFFSYSRFKLAPQSQQTQAMFRYSSLLALLISLLVLLKANNLFSIPTIIVVGIMIIIIELLWRRRPFIKLGKI